MFSVPVVGWAADGLAYGWSLYQEVMRQGGPEVIDLIDAHFEYPDGVGAWLAGRRLGVPVVVTLRGKLVSLSRTAVRRAQIAAMLRGVDAVIAVSGSLASLAREVAGRDLRVDVIPNGVDRGVFHQVDCTAARAALGWEADKRYVLCVGHYQRLKGFDRLVEAWPAVRAAAGDVRLVLAGSRRGERGFAGQIAQRVKALGLEGCVLMLGTVDSSALNRMYNVADLSVNASRSEGWCNAMAESLAAGTPVVATDVGGNREQNRSDELGIIGPDGDGRAMVEGITAGLERRWDRVRIAAHGGERGWEQVAFEVSQVFERVVAERRRASCTMRQPRADCSVTREGAS
jgi:glycosyltransferase involved in cell wall biosynthesis